MSILVALAISATATVADADAGKLLIGPQLLCHLCS